MIVPVLSAYSDNYQSFSLKHKRKWSSKIVTGGQKGSGTQFPFMTNLGRIYRPFSLCLEKNVFYCSFKWARFIFFKNFPVSNNGLKYKLKITQEIKRWIDICTCVFTVWFYVIVKTVNNLNVHQLLNW